MITVLITTSILYSLWIIYLMVHWRRIKETKDTPIEKLPGVSIVIAFRNEAHQMTALLKMLSEQVYPTDALEVILVNDHSEDSYKPKIESFSSFPFPLKVLSLNEGQYGKKQAMAYGIKHASHEWILTTDADCTAGRHWVRSMMQHAMTRDARFVFGSVAFTTQKSFLTDFQQIELTSLIGSGAALWHAGLPTMCNGANLLYRKELVAEDPYAENKHLASGDDEFLMHEVYSQNPQHVTFSKNKETLVHTEPCSSWLALYHQRKRWASKWGAYKMPHVKQIALGIFIINTIYLLTPLMLFFSSSLMSWIIGLYVFRFTADGIFIHEINRFYNKPFNLVRYVQVATIYPCYVVISALAGRVGKYTWKGRKVN